MLHSLDVGSFYYPPIAHISTICNVYFLNCWHFLPIKVAIVFARGDQLWNRVQGVQRLVPAQVGSFFSLFKVLFSSPKHRLNLFSLFLDFYFPHHFSCSLPNSSQFSNRAPVSLYFFFWQHCLQLCFLSTSDCE